ncbi:hypothetical protein D3C80_1567590 [compost metagenome]
MALATDKRRHGDQLHGLGIELAVIGGVPAVPADKHPQTPGGGIDDLQQWFAAAMYITALSLARIALALWLPQWFAIAAEHQAAVV